MGIGNVFNNQGGTATFGGGGSSDGTIKEVSFTNQTSLSISHDFSHHPSVIVIDASGNLIEAEVQYNSRNNILINFAVSVSGTVIIR
tara:strand:+ start:40 stop:300 length:261 start_codon:yes stop_codon:yes gene_type:complete